MCTDGGLHAAVFVLPTITRAGNNYHPGGLPKVRVPSLARINVWRTFYPFTQPGNTTAEVSMVTDLHLERYTITDTGGRVTPKS